MAAYSSAALPIPAVIEIGAAGDGYFAVSERAPGELLDGLDGAGMRAVLPGLLAALDALRDIDVSGTGGTASGRRTGPARRRAGRRRCWRSARRPRGFPAGGPPWPPPPSARAL